jgi:predicted Zn finger-like uncharacterized protein
MLVSCPTCPAEYEIAESELGSEGRVVECSACGARWLQPAPATATAASASTIPGLAEARRTLDDLKDADAPDLREESLYGADEDKAEEPEETAPALAAVMPAPEPTPLRRGPGPDLSPARPIEDVAVDPDEAPRRSARRGGDLPDAARLNAELRASAHEEERVERRRRGGFRSGLLLVLIIGGIGAGLYHGRDEIVGLAPQAAAPLDGYIAAVDDGKAQAMIWADQAMAKIKPMIGQDAPAPAPEAAPAAPTPATSTPAAPAPTPEPAAPQAAAPVNAAPTAPAPRAPIASMTTDPASAPIAMPSMPTMSAPATPAAPEPSPMPSTASTN